MKQVEEYCRGNEYGVQSARTAEAGHHQFNGCYDYYSNVHMPIIIAHLCASTHSLKISCLSYCTGTGFGAPRTPK